LSASAILRTISATDGAAISGYTRIPVHLRLPGKFNLGNAVMAMAAASVLGVEPGSAAMAMGAVDQVEGRYSTVRRGPHELQLLLAKNPAGWAETLALIDPSHHLMVMINARGADGRDTSWLWDVPFEQVRNRAVAVAGEHSADIGLRLSYAGIEHVTVSDPIAAIEMLPPNRPAAGARRTSRDKPGRDVYNLAASADFDACAWPPLNFYVSEKLMKKSATDQMEKRTSAGRPSTSR